MSGLNDWTRAVLVAGIAFVVLCLGMAANGVGSVGAAVRVLIVCFVPVPLIGWWAGEFAKRGAPWAWKRLILIYAGLLFVLMLVAGVGSPLSLGERGRG